MIERINKDHALTVACPIPVSSVTVKKLQGAIAEASTLTFRQVAHIDCAHITKLVVAMFGASQKFDRTIAMISVGHRNLMHEANTD